MREGNFHFESPIILLFNSIQYIIINNNNLDINTNIMGNLLKENERVK